VTRHPLQTALFRAALVGVAAALVGCLGIHTRRPYDPSQARSDADVDRTKPTLPEQQIDEFGFAVYWDSFIRDEVITGVWVEGTGRDPLRTDRALRRGSKPQLYAFTAAHRLYQIDMHSGMVNWVYDVGKPLSFMDGRPIAEWSYTERDQETGLQFYDEIFFVANDWLYALDKDNGSLLWRLELPFGASSPPAASRTHVFVGAWNDRIYAIQKDRPSVIDWNWRTDGDLVARPAVDSDSSQVFVASSDGNLYTFDAAKGDLVYRQRLNFRRGRIDPSLCLAGGNLYISSNAGVTYVVKPGRKYQFVARNELEGTSSTPFFVDDKMIWRGRKMLYCVQAATASK